MGKDLWYSEGQLKYVMFFTLNILLGDVIHLSALGDHVVYVNSFAAATELLEKRSSIYSARPRLVMVTEM